MDRARFLPLFCLAALTRATGETLGIMRTHWIDAEMIVRGAGVIIFSRAAPVSGSREFAGEIGFRTLFRARWRAFHFDDCKTDLILEGSFFYCVGRSRRGGRRADASVC